MLYSSPKTGISRSTCHTDYRPCQKACGARICAHRLMSEGRSRTVVDPWSSPSGATRNWPGKRRGCAGESSSRVLGGLWRLIDGDVSATSSTARTRSMAPWCSMASRWPVGACCKLIDRTCWVRCSHILPVDRAYRAALPSGRFPGSASIRSTSSRIS